MHVNARRAIALLPHRVRHLEKAAPGHSEVHDLRLARHGAWIEVAVVAFDACVVREERTRGNLVPGRRAHVGFRPLLDADVHELERARVGVDTRFRATPNRGQPHEGVDVEVGARLTRPALARVGEELPRVDHVCRIGDDSRTRVGELVLGVVGEGAEAIRYRVLFEMRVQLRLVARPYPEHIATGHVADRSARFVVGGAAVATDHAPI